MKTFYFLFRILIRGLLLMVLLLSGASLSMAQCISSGSIQPQGSCSGCSTPASGSTITLNTANQTVCYTGTTTINTINVGAQNVTIYICGSGTITIQNFNSWGNNAGLNLVVNQGATLNFTNSSTQPYFFNDGSSSAGVLTNYGTVNITAPSAMGIGGTVINASASSILTFYNGLTLNGGLVQVVNGQLNVSGTLAIQGSNLLCLSSFASLSVGTLTNCCSPGIIVPVGSSSCISLTGTFTSSGKLISTSSTGQLDLCIHTGSTYPSYPNASLWGSAIPTFNCNSPCNIVLPVLLEEFNLLASGQKVIAEWVTTHEANSRQFEIQRAGSENDFVTIGTVAAEGNSSYLQNYSYTDPAPLTGLNRYRLKITDEDGLFTYSETREIQFSGTREMSVITQASSKTIQVILPSHTSSGILRLLDMQGRVLKASAATSSKQSILIEAPANSTGIYIIEWLSSTQRESRQVYLP